MNVALVRVLYARARRGVAPCTGTVRSARPPARRPPARDGRCLSLTPPRAPKPLSARARRGALHRRRAASRPAARLRGDRVAAAAHVRVVRRRLGEPRLLELVRDGNPIYAWPFEERHVWRSPHAGGRAGSRALGPGETKAGSNRVERQMIRLPALAPRRLLSRRRDTSALPVLLCLRCKLRRRAEAVERSQASRSR